MQLNATRIWCTFFDKETGEWKVLTFTLFTEALFSGRKHQLRECVLTLHPRIIVSLRNRHYFCLNYNRLTRLEPIGMVLFKHLFFQMSRKYSKVRDQNFSYERNYDAICATWLGGLRILPYKSKIISEQLGSHLRSLQQIKLIKSFDFIRNDSGGYKLIVKPGSGFFEDYERYYGTQRQLPFPFKRAAEENSIKRPLDLLSYFHKKRLGVEELAEQVFSEKKTAFARTLTQKYPDELCREIVDFGLTRAHEQKYDPQTLPGIGQYINEFFATMQERDRLARARAVREEMARLEATQERQKELYEVFYKTEIMRVRKGLSPEELEELEAPLRAQFREKYPGLKVGIDTYVYFEGNAILQQRYKMPTFEEWQAQNPA